MKKNLQKMQIWAKPFFFSLWNRNFQIFMSSNFQTNIESQVSAMAYLDLIVRTVSEPGMMQIVVRFLLDDEKFDGQRILDVLIERLNTNDSRVSKILKLSKKKSKSRSWSLEILYTVYSLFYQPSILSKCDFIHFSTWNFQFQFINWTGVTHKLLQTQLSQITFQITNKICESLGKIQTFRDECSSIMYENPKKNSTESRGVP